MSSRNIFTRFIGGTWRLLDVFRRFVHLILMVLVFVGLVAALGQGKPALPKAAALLIEPAGQVVEQRYGDPVEQALDELAGNGQAQTSVRDLVDGLRAAAADDRIKAVAMDLSGFMTADLSKLQRLGRELDDFRASGKKVVAYGDFLLQPQYYLAAHADEVYLHPSGAVYLDGYGRFRTYYRSAIEKLKIDWHVFRVGEYKSFVEPYLRDDMSEEDRASSLEWLNELWRQYQQDVVRVRGLEAGDIHNYVAQFVERLEANDGDLARVALNAGLVDELRTRDQVRLRLIELAGEDEKTHSFKQIGLEAYVADTREPDGETDKIGVVVAAGEILDGDQPPGVVGGDTLSRLLRKARHDENVKAVVLRIDSPGGSKFASEIIQREVQLLREAGKPVVASMGGVAASGGYYIAMDADEIWATSSTITGSIGIGAYLPTFSRSLDWLGIHVDGVGTTNLSGQFRPDRELSDEAAQILQLSIEDGYRDFIEGVASGRGMTTDEVDKIARGRVWIGSTAEQIGLVDQLGGLDAAIESAAARANLDDYGVTYIQKELSFREQMALSFVTRIRSILGVHWQPGTLNRIVGQITDELARLSRLNDPNHLYYHCLCDLR
ncbi:MAG: signal peptide peptidase SppA [Gammaproteobacteria bacterium]|nr:signal peptide peptidase SppA [Gammaproteobacteria bacterium]NNF61769.1 signal peptide peptidase SppA [Gammaproteobacteria bacterium]NNM20434.1 signal peptide peptidase SppA [Gammaproteobacteria bacterium]